MAHVGLIVLVALIGTGSFLFLAFVPLGGAAGWKVAVNVTFYEVSLVVHTVYGVSSVSGSTAGPSPAVSLGNSLSVSIPGVLASYVATVCVGAGTSHCAQQSSSQWFPSVPFVNGAKLEATDTFDVGNVPAGQQPITVNLAVDGSVQATGSGSMCVGSGGGC